MCRRSVRGLRGRRAELRRTGRWGMSTGDPVWPPEDIDDTSRDERVMRVDRTDRVGASPSAPVHTPPAPPPPPAPGRPPASAPNLPQPLFGAAQAFPRRRAPEPRSLEIRLPEQATPQAR